MIKTIAVIASSIIPIILEEIPSGAIILWMDDESDIPSGFVKCDGDNDTPNLSGRFVMGAGTTGSGDTGGGGTHNHSISSASSHTHSGLPSRDNGPTWHVSSTSQSNSLESQTAGAVYRISTHGSHSHGTSGSSGGHNHGGSTGSSTTEPENIRGIWIMKT